MMYVPFSFAWIELMRTKDTPEKQLAFVEAIFDYATEGKVPPAPREMSHPKGIDYARRDGYLAAKDTLDTMLACIKGGLAKKRKYEMPIPPSDTPFQYPLPEAPSDKGFTEVNKINKENKINKNNTPDGVSVSDYETLFEQWWISYPGPRRVDKRKCRDKFFRILKTSKEEPVAMFNRLMDGLEKWKRSETWTRDGGKYIRAPMVWLNNENWNDAPTSATPSGTGCVRKSEDGEKHDAF